MRKKGFLLLISLLPACNSAYTQVDTVFVNSTHKKYLSFSAGTSLPLDKFSLYEIQYQSNTNLAGAAKTGFNAKLEAGYIFSRYHLGITLDLYSSTFKTANEVPDDIFPHSRVPALGGGSRVLSYTYTAKNWNINGVHIGFTAEILSRHLMSFRLRMAGGLQQVISPETRLVENGYTWQINWPDVKPFTASLYQPGLTAWNLAFNEGVDIYIRLAGRLNLIIALDYFTSRASFHGEITEDYQDATGISNSGKKATTDFVKDISVFNLNFGFVYKLAKKG